MEDIAPLVDSLDLMRLPRGTRQSFRLRVAQVDTAILSVPINVMSGVTSGRIVVAVAGIHGNEVEGVLALIELWEELAPEHLTGTLVLVPVANPPAFAAHQRTSPLDGLDLNRIFPGKSDGRPSEQLAHRFFVEVVMKADFVFSMHSWLAAGRVLPYVEFGHLIAETSSRSFEAAEACGFDLIRISQWSTGLMTRVANEHSVPGIEVELGGLGISCADLRARYKLHLRKLLQHLAMLEGIAVRGSKPRVVRHVDVTSSAVGILRPTIELGDEIREGERLGVLSDLNGRWLRDIHSPVSGLVAAVYDGVSVQVGTHLFRLFQDVDYPSPGNREPGKSI